MTDNPFVPPADGRCIINELPAELLAYIFELGFIADGEGDDDDDDDDESCDSLCHDNPCHCFDRDFPFELLVTRICRQWREVATGLSSLWSTLKFIHEDPDDPDFLVMERNTQYLERAKGAPLDIEIDLMFNEIDDEDDHHALMNEESSRSVSSRYRQLSDILELLIPHVDHWRSFELTVSHYLLMQQALEALAHRCKAGAPLLEVLQLYHYEEGDIEPTFQPAHLKEQAWVLFGNNAPRLNTVALWGVHLNWRETKFLTGLVDFELAYHAMDVRPSYWDFLQILKNSPALITLTLCESGPAGTPVDWLHSVLRQEDEEMANAASPLSSHPAFSSGSQDKQYTSYTLSTTQKLVLAYIPADYAIAILDRLSMPQLDSLALDFNDDGDDDYAALVTRLCSPSPGSSKSLFSGLEALKLSGLRCRMQQPVLQAGQALQNLRQMNVNFNHVDFEWLDLLIDPTRLNLIPTDPANADAGAAVLPGTVFCPRLEIYMASGLDGVTVRELLEARKAVGRPIKELYLDQEEPLTDEDAEWVRQNVEVFDYYEGSDEDEDVFDESIDDEDEDEFDEEDFDVEWDMDLAVEDEMEGDEEEWTDED